ncbi:MAG: hypothetical protein NVSMB13_05770 [Mycobacteriales bacterium]
MVRQSLDDHPHLARALPPTNPALDNADGTDQRLRAQRRSWQVVLTGSWCHFPPPPREGHPNSDALPCPP